MECGKNVLFLHKNEWNRMKNIGAPTELPKTDEYVQSLIEKSQQWINSWSDSVQGHLLKREKEEKKQHAKDMALIKLFRKKQKEIWKKDKRIEDAKQMIFEDSCYGKRLISALLESKTLEERNVQIEFQKKLKEKAQREDRDTFGGSILNAIDVGNEETARAACIHEIEKEIARINRTTYLTQCEKRKEKKERQKQMELNDLRLIAELNEKETLLETHKKDLFKTELEQCNAEQKDIQNRKALKEKQEEQIIEVWRKYEDRKNCTMKKIHEKSLEKSQSTEIYELVKKINDDKQNRYDEFVDKGITALTQRLQIKEEEENRKSVDKLKEQRLLVQANKKLEEAKQHNKTNKNMCACDRQCIIAKTKNIPEIKKLPQEQDSITFSPSNNRLVKNLKIREKEPSPWGSASAAHAQFARHAGITLQECRHKNAARKVVDDYRRLHGLQPEDLPVANYF